jgi:hypothetical protein
MATRGIWSLLLCLVVTVVACGRSELDLGGVDNLPANTGEAGGSGTATTTGTAGVTGAAGAAGVTGVAGTTGSAGHPGAAGTTGAAGVTGSAGRPGAAGTTGAAGRPGGGPGGTGGAPPPPPTPIPCGNTTCTPGTQTCCIRFQNGAAGASCIGAHDTCQAGTTIGCIDTPSCGPGSICCLSTQMLSTNCNRPAACLLSPGLILCSADSECPGLLPHCCGIGNLRICRAQACGGGGPGPGGGGGGGRRQPPPPPPPPGA